MGPISSHSAVVAPQATLSCVEQQWVARIPAITPSFHCLHVQEKGVAILFGIYITLSVMHLSMFKLNYKP